MAMLYLHCGWPKTGTSSFQAALVKHRDLLADAGFLYPDAWRPHWDDAHSGLGRVLNSFRTPDGAAYGEFDAFLKNHRGKEALLSSEGLTMWLLTDEKHKALTEFLSTIRAVAPVRCVWTLRRFDNVIHAHYLQPLDHQPRRFGVAGDSVAEVMEGIEVDHIFARMRAVEEVVDGDVAYVRYDSAGSHNTQLLRALRVPTHVVRVICRELNATPRRNVAMTHKEAVAISHVKALSLRFGFEVDRRALLEAFRRGFRFADDRPCELAGYSARHNLHERMLAAAVEGGLPAYVRFYGNEKIDKELCPSNMEYDVLGHADLRRLSAYLRQGRGADRSAMSGASG